MSNKVRVILKTPRDSSGNRTDMFPVTSSDEVIVDATTENPISLTEKLKSLEGKTQVGTSSTAGLVKSGSDVIIGTDGTMSVNNVEWSKVSRKPLTYAPSEHKQAYTSAECTDNVYKNTDDEHMGVTPKAVYSAIDKYTFNRLAQLESAVQDLLSIANGTAYIVIDRTDSRIDWTKIGKTANACFIGEPTDDLTSYAMSTGNTRVLAGDGNSDYGRLSTTDSQNLPTAYKTVQAQKVLFDKSSSVNNLVSVYFTDISDAEAAGTLIYSDKDKASVTVPKYISEYYKDTISLTIPSDTDVTTSASIK